MFPRRIGEAQTHPYPATVFCLHPPRHHVALRMTHGTDMITTVSDGELRRYHACPHIKLLVDIFQVGGLQVLHLQAVTTEVQTMRIHAIPLGGTTRTTVLTELSGIELFMSVTEVFLLIALLYAQLLGVVETVPPPVALRTEGHPTAVIFREGLHASDVGGNGETAVADTQRCQGINAMHHRVITLHKRLAVNSLRRRDHRQRDK